MNVLLLENISIKAHDYLVSQGYNVERLQHSLSEEDLIKYINQNSIQFIGIRSKTNITKNVTFHSPSLLGIFCFCIGTNQVDLENTRNKGIAVFNSPFASTRSVAELTICYIISLARNVCVKNSEMHNNMWNKTSKNMYEIRGKKLGIVGYGHVGSQVSILAESLGMEILYYDIKNVMPLGNSEKCYSLTEILQKSDFITLHVPLDETTENMIEDKEIKMMKKGSYLINLSRGKVVNLEDVKKNIIEGYLGGVAIDVFPSEPKGNGIIWETGMNNLHNVILSPHIGGATQEAQNAIGLDVAQKLINYHKTGSTEDCVNLPNVITNSCNINNTKRICCIHQNRPGILSNMNDVYRKYNVNIIQQHLSTQGNIGYCVTEIVKSDKNKLILDEINNFLDGNIRTFIT